MCQLEQAALRATPGEAAARWVIVPAAPWGGTAAVFGPFTPFTAEAEFGRLKGLAGGVVAPVLVSEVSRA